MSSTLTAIELTYERTGKEVDLEPATRASCEPADYLQVHSLSTTNKLETEEALKIGVISDTHGLMRPQALEALAGSDLILHAGDVGSPAILEVLGTIAPVVAVRGNNDTGNWADKLRETEVIQAGGCHFYMLHNAKEMDVDPVTAGFRVVISGHSHRPSHEERAGVLYLNPGSAGPRRFKLPVAVARLQVNGSVIRAEIVQLLV